MQWRELDDLLRQHRATLHELGVRRLACFGSVARGEARAGSDVDLLVDFAAPPTFNQFMNLKFFLEDLLECRVDLVTRQALRPQLRAQIEQEALYAPEF